MDTDGIIREIHTLISLIHQPRFFLHPVISFKQSHWEAKAGDLIGCGKTPEKALDAFESHYWNGFIE